jgi:hypothetical protein
MRRAGLIWYRLSFPRDLDQEAVLATLASLSGLPAPSRLVLNLSASREGIEHYLGATPAVAEVVTGALRAAIPSLRLTESEAISGQFQRRLLWQLVPADGVVRSDELASISAGLLASLFPLMNGEAIRLGWTLRPSPKPRWRLQPDREWSGRAHALRAKLTAPGLTGVGQLQVNAQTSARAAELMRRISAPLWSLSLPYGRLVADPYWLGQLGRWFGLRGRYLSIHELAAVIGWPIGGPDLPGLELGAAKRLVPSRRLQQAGRVLGTTDFVGLTQPVALSPEASTRGLYVLGPTGTGKTSLIKNLVRDDLTAGRGLAVVETNGDLIRDLLDLIPPERENDVVLLDPTDQDYAVGLNPFTGSSDASLVADQLGELFERLWKDFWGPRTAQLAHMGLLTLARRQGATLLDLPRLFLDSTFRNQVVGALDDPVGLEPDWRWFGRLPQREQATVVAPLMNKVRQFTARPSIRAIIGQPKPPLSMQRLMAEQKVLLVHLPKGLIGNETAKLLGCLVLIGLWQAATERARLTAAERQPFGLYVDEVQDFADAPVPWDEMFAQGRKYGLALTAAHQNLAQLPRDLRETVLANARSKAVFALSAADARVLEPLFTPALTAADLQSLDAYAAAALVALDDGSTAPPVTLVTRNVPAGLESASRVRDLSRQHYGRPSAAVHAELRQRAAEVAPAAPVGRKRRQP